MWKWACAISFVLVVVSGCAADPVTHSVDIENSGGTQQEGYEACAYGGCGATLVDGVSIPPDEYSEVEDPADYTANVVSVKVGDSVQWSNIGVGVHTVTASDGSFASETMNPNSEYTFQFDQAGEYEYFCVPHPQMRAKIVVEP
jgi:plastocyanin